MSYHSGLGCHSRRLEAISNSPLNGHCCNEYWSTFIPGLFMRDFR
ncbi:unnamed protein product [Tenebrio molitor]|nr:unnamed protein product [Tenebrio molitor]